jgi:FkbH-like protein
MTDVTFKQLKRLAAAGANDLPGWRVALLGDASTQFLGVALRGYGVLTGHRLELFEADYDQLERQIHDAHSELYAFNPEIVILQPTSQKLAKRFYACAISEKETFWERELARLGALVDSLCAGTQAKVLCYNFTALDDGIYGQAANKTRLSLSYQIRRLNLGLMELCAENPRLFICDLALLQAQVGQRALFDNRLYHAAQLPIALELLPQVAKQALDILAVLAGRIKKCLVLDLDNTLWGGVIGEDGLENLQLGELGVGSAFTAMQVWAKQLQERGVLLAICSKNDDTLARSVFTDHPDMVLKLADIAVFKANWETKVDNLRAIRDSLNIGLDALVFVDDNPFERQMVRELLPEVCVPELPTDPADYLETLVGLNLFEAPAGSGDDAKRTLRYQQESERRATEATFASVESYLASLEMQAGVTGFEPFWLPRIAQLTQRSNQFNLRTVRYTEADLAGLAGANDTLARGFTLGDRFGDYGLVGAVIVVAQDPESWFIDTWLMSCRVLKRGLEDFMCNEIAGQVLARGGRWLVGEYVPTPKNGLVKDLLPNLGFSQDERGWVLDVTAFTPRVVAITRAVAAPDVAAGDVVVRRA